MDIFDHEHIEIVKAELLKRKSKNSSYSLRSFAKSLDTPAGVLSQIIAGKRALTLDRAMSWLEKLKLSDEDNEKFLNSVKTNQFKRLDKTEKKIRDLKKDYKKHLFSLDHFELIANWYHLAILNLIETKDFNAHPSWISKRLNLDQDDVELALERLKRLKLITIKNGVIKRTHNAIETPADIPSHAVRSYHKQNIERALNAIDNVEISQRDISAITLPVSQNTKEEIKKRINAFRLEISSLTSGEANDVYNLNIQFFPQTHTVEDSP